MEMSKDEARALLRDRGLRSTAPRVAVLRLLAEAPHPLSYRDVLERLGDSDWDPTTIYRNLVKLAEVGIAPVVSRVEGQDRYALRRGDGGSHRHPHFVCMDCGKLECLPAELTATLALEGRWSASIRAAAVQLQGTCPDCLPQS